MTPLPLPSWLTDTTDQSRRLTSRIPCELPRCNLGEIIDISATGARIACKRFFRPVEGKPVRLTITPASGEPLHIAAIVCWTHLDASGWQAGLEYHSLSVADTEKLVVFAREHRFNEPESRSA